MKGFVFDWIFNRALRLSAKFTRGLAKKLPKVTPAQIQALDDLVAGTVATKVGNALPE